LTAVKWQCSLSACNYYINKFHSEASAMYSMLSKCFPLLTLVHFDIRVLHWCFTVFRCY